MSPTVEELEKKIISLQEEVKYLQMRIALFNSFFEEDSVAAAAALLVAVQRVKRSMK